MFLLNQICGDGEQTYHRLFQVCCMRICCIVHGGVKRYPPVTRRSHSLDVGALVADLLLGHGEPSRPQLTRHHLLATVAAPRTGRRPKHGFVSHHLAAPPATGQRESEGESGGKRQAIGERFSRYIKNTVGR